MGVVVSGPPTGSPFREKHLAGVRYEPIAIAASLGSARPLFDLVRSAWQGMPTQNNGAVIRIGAAVIRIGANGRPVSRREFVKALLAETIVPKLWRIQQPRLRHCPPCTRAHARRHATGHTAACRPRAARVPVIQFPAQYRRPRLHQSRQDRFVHGEAAPCWGNSS